MLSAQYIIEQCVAYAEVNGLHLCGKQPVYAAIVTTTGEVIFGSNYRHVAVDCMRKKLNCASGFGYEHCDNICHQLTHAERVAIQFAKDKGVDITGATLYLTGHTYCCTDCKAAMVAAGIKDYHILDKNEYHVL